jgi:hypothetical protein
MADPKTILEYATQRSDSAEQALTDAQKRLADAQAALVAATSESKTASAELADLERRIDDIRQKLSGIVTPADGEVLLDALELATIRLRSKQAAVVKSNGKFSVAQANVAQAQTDVAAASVVRNQAQTALTQATAANEAREALVQALDDAPVKDLPTEVGKALDPANPVEGAAFKKAKERIEGDIPEKLLKRAEDRRKQAGVAITQEDKNVTAAEDALLKEGETNNGRAGAAAKAWVAFQRAEAAARSFVNTAEDSFNNAKSTFKEVGDSTRAPLTAEQKALIDDADLKDDREAAVGEEETIDTGVAQDLSAKQILLDEAILKAKADPSDTNLAAVETAQGDVEEAQSKFDEDNGKWREKETDLVAANLAVDQKSAALTAAIQKAVAAGSDPNTDPDVAFARGELTTAENHLKDADEAYRLSDHGILDLWEAAVPDATWRLFEKYEDALDILNTLKLVNPAGLKADLTAKEEAYVTAQVAADKSANILQQLAAEQAQRVARHEGAEQVADARRFSALRGDE